MEISGNVAATYQYKSENCNIICYIMDAAFTGIPKEEIDHRIAHMKTVAGNILYQAESREWEQSK